MNTPGPLFLSGKRILVVDNDAANRALAKALLELWGCAAEPASDTESALIRLKDQTRDRFDSIVISDQMLQPNGKDLAATIRLDGRLANTPIVLLVANHPGLPRRWESYGFVGRIAKPINGRELADCLVSAIRAIPAGDVKTSTNTDRLERRASQHILVVEDELVNQEVALGVLESLGYQADIASDAYTAVRALRERDYAIVLTDCQLPEIDGYELARLIRDPSTKIRNLQIPIVAVTANSLAIDREECLAAGMNDYLAKPIRPKMLEGILSRWIVTAECLAEDRVGVSATDVHADSLSNAEQFSGNDLIERLMGNEELAKWLAGAFLDSMPQQLAALAAAINSFDAKATRHTAHAIKGIAANLGTVAVRDLASQLEKLGETGSLASASQILPELAAGFQAVEPVIQRFCRGESES